MTEHKRKKYRWHTPVFSNGVRGFTLVELVIVFAIIAILSGIAFVAGRSGDKSLALDRSSYKVAQDMRRVAGLALRAEVSGICDAVSGQLSGYGLDFDKNMPTTYLLYANCDGVGDEGYSNGQDEEVETLTLDPAIEIGAVSNGGKWSVAFFPPDGRVAICKNGPCGGGGPFSLASLTLRIKSDPTKTKTITINEKGTISID